jgi:putative ABC transport system permease protein
VNAIGQYITFQGKRFMVAGVMKKVGQNMAGFDFDNGIIYSYFAAAAMIDIKSLNYDPFLMIRPVDGKSVDELKYEVEGALRRVRKVEPGKKNDFAMNQLSQVTERLNAVFGIINWVGAIIALFSLIAGGVGIANIMFVTVKERTKIIGLKKAIGATSGSVLMEFLIEAVTLCITGGIIGIITVLLLSVILTYGLDFPVTLSLQNFVIGISISAGIGILAGYIPARSASKLDPVVAIRSH